MLVYCYNASSYHLKMYRRHIISRGKINNSSPICYNGKFSPPLSSPLVEYLGVRKKYKNYPGPSQQSGNGHPPMHITYSKLI